MKFTKIRNGYYRSENGFYIKGNGYRHMFTGKQVQADFWYIYDGEVTNNRKWIGGECTLKEAKAEVERMSKEYEIAYRVTVSRRTTDTEYMLDTMWNGVSKKGIGVIMKDVAQEFADGKISEYRISVEQVNTKKTDVLNLGAI